MYFIHFVSVSKLWTKTNFQSSNDMDRHLIGDPSLSSLDADLKSNYIHQHANTTGYINDLCSPVSDSVTAIGNRDHLFYHQHLKSNLNSNLDTIVLSPGAVLKSTSSPRVMQRSYTHDFTTTKTILIPFSSKISDEFMYSLEHVLWRQLPAVTWPAINNVDVALSQSTQQLPSMHQHQLESSSCTLNPLSMSSLEATPPLFLRRDMISASTQTEICRYSRIDLRNADSFGDDIAYIDESSASNTRPTSKDNSSRNSKFINEHTIYITQECPEYIL